MRSQPIFANDFDNEDEGHMDNRQETHGWDDLPPVTLADLRRMRNITQEGLAEILGTDQAQIAKIEKRGPRRGPTRTLENYVRDGLGYGLEIVVRDGDKRYLLTEPAEPTFS